ncbi:MAG: PepSY-like domain-containing protein [Tannerella sp.]|jgi:hypothetical protein|nr:PepSY-like domain-containing protein [Tannerella sp.]
MKKIVLIYICSLFSVVFAIADNEMVTSDTSQLPSASQQFITKYFADTEIAHIVIEKNFFRITGYEVFLTNGVDIEFDNSGTWTEVDGNHNEIPKALIPEEISNYINRNYALNKISAIERESHGFQIKLNNGIELIFDRNGHFKRIDD